MESKNKQINKKVEVAILASDGMDFKATKIKRGHNGKGSMQQEELMILDVSAPNTGYIRLVKRLGLPHSSSGRFQHQY